MSLSLLALALSCATSRNEKGNGASPTAAADQPEGTAEAQPEGTAATAEGEPPAAGEATPAGGETAPDPGEAAATPAETPVDSQPATPSGLPSDDPAVMEFLAARQQADWKLAEEKLEAIMRQSPSDSKALYNLALVVSRQGRLEEGAAKAIKALEADSTNVAAGRLAIALLGRLGRPSEAEAAIEAAANAQPKNVDVQSLKLELLMAKKEYQRAIDSASQLLKLDEVNVPVMKNLARAYYLVGKHKTAKFVYDRALELEKGDPEILYYLALIGTKNESLDRTQAMALWSKVLAVRPDLPEALNNVGNLFYETRNYEQAAEKFAEAVKAAPDFKEAKLNLANALRGAKQFPEADRTYDELAREHPDYAAAYFNRGLLYLENEFAGLGVVERMEKAAAYLRQYKEVAGRELRASDPADSYIREALQMAEEYKKAQEEESKAAAESAAKFERMGPVAVELLQAHKERRARMEKALAAWQAAANTDKVNLFQGLIAEYDELMNYTYSELQSAYDNKSGDDIESLQESVKGSLEEFQPKIDDAFSEPPPEAETPPPSETPSEMPPGEGAPPVETPPTEETTPPVEETAPPPEGTGEAALGELLDGEQPPVVEEEGTPPEEQPPVESEGEGVE
jgi:tetratricopeptide (TPR) repeat protein